MPKKTPKTPSEVKPKVNLLDTFQIPEGFTEQSGDLVGYYDGQSVIQLVPMYVKMFDSSLDTSKPSLLLTARLCADTSLIDKDGNYIDGIEGELIGVWLKPGMKGLVPHEGHVCHVVPAGEMQTGKPNPMAVYKIFSGDKAGPRIPVLEDARVKSRSAKTMFDLAGQQQSHNAF